MNQNTINAYQRNAILTASPAELTLMLYDGAIKFCNIAIMAIEKKDMEKAHVNLKKAQAIISELRVTLDHKYSVWEDFDRVYDYIYRRLVEGNMSKEIDVIEDALKYIREKLPVRSNRQDRCEGMPMNSNNSVYVRMMVDVLKRKEKILQQILEQTKEQEVILKQEDVDYDRFQELLDEKGRQIDELNQIDEGFDALFKKVEKEITVHKENYLTEIVTMQKLISAVSDLGLRIQALEAQNSERFKIYLASKRKQIHDYHVNSQTASRYYQNMANSHRPEQSYYFNEKQ